MLSLFEALSPIGALAVNFLCQIILHRAVKRARYLPVMVVGTLAGLGIQLLAFYVLHGAPDTLDLHVQFFGQVATYLCLSFGLFAYANLGEASLRIRLLQELADEPEGLSWSVIGKNYSERNIFAKRMERLIAANQVFKKDGRFFLRGKALPVLAKVMTFMKLILLRKRSEFDAPREKG